MNTFSDREGKTPFLLLLFSLFIIGSLNLFAGTLEIIRPLANTVVDESEISVVVKVTDPAVTKISFTDAQGREVFRELQKGKQIYCQSLKAQMGNNRISVTSYTNTDKGESQTVSVYYRAEMFSGFQEPPSGYKKGSFHTDKGEQLCKTCHKMIQNAAQQIVPDNSEDSACYQCHKHLVNRAKGHAPSVNWMCTECHTGEAGEYGDNSIGKSKYTAPDPIMERCFSCHDNIKQAWFARKSEHGPVRDGRCNRCHNPHSSDELFFTRKPIWDLCTTCHSEKATGAHVINSYVQANSHPTRGKPDPAAMTPTDRKGSFCSVPKGKPHSASASAAIKNKIKKSDIKCRGIRTLPGSNKILFLKKYVVSIRLRCRKARNGLTVSNIYHI